MATYTVTTTVCLELKSLVDGHIVRLIVIVLDAITLVTHVQALCEL
jgi:hypothetical protein